MINIRRNAIFDSLSPGINIWALDMDFDISYLYRSNQADYKELTYENIK